MSPKIWTPSSSTLNMCTLPGNCQVSGFTIHIAIPVRLQSVQILPFLFKCKSNLCKLEKIVTFVTNQPFLDLTTESLVGFVGLSEQVN